MIDRVSASTIKNDPLSGANSFRLGPAEIGFGGLEILFRRGAVLEEFTGAVERPFRQVKITLGAAGVGLCLAEIRGGDQRECVVLFHRLADIGGDLRNTAGEGGEHAHGHPIVPHDSTVQRNCGAVVLLGGHRPHRRQLRTSRWQDDLVPFHPWFPGIVRLMCRRTAALDEAAQHEQKNSRKDFHFLSGSSPGLFRAD